MSTPETDEIHDLDPSLAFVAKASGVDLVTLSFDTGDVVRRPGIVLDLVPVTNVEEAPRPETVVLTVAQAYSIVAGLVDALTILEDEVASIDTTEEVADNA